MFVSLLDHRGFGMASLEWHRAKDDAWLPPDTPLDFGKSVYMSGWDYVDRYPQHFYLYRVASPLVQWGLKKRGHTGEEKIGDRPARLNA